MDYSSLKYNIGFFGNSSLIFYSPKTDDHPSVNIGDAVSSNFFYCSSFDLYPEYQADTGEYIRGFPDRHVFSISPIKISGNIQQKMLARIDGSPDYVTSRLYEHLRHVWAGYEFSMLGDGSGVDGIPGSLFSPYFSIFSDQFGIYSGCLVDSMEFIAEADSQVVINYGIVAKKLWTEDTPKIRDLMNILLTNRDASAPMRQIFCTDCAMTVGNNDVSNPVKSTFSLVSGGESPFLKGYNFPDLPDSNRIIRMSLKINNFLEPNYTMQAKYVFNDRIDRENGIRKRIEENLWPRNFYPSKPRQISGEVTWITDIVPIDIKQRIAGTASNQMVSNSEKILGESILMYFGPMVIRIQNPIWSLGKPELIYNQLYKINIRFLAASDAELILQPTESWL